MTKSRLILAAALTATITGCGGGSSSGGSGSDSDSTPWIGQWRGVSQDGQSVDAGNSCQITYTANTMTWNHCGICETTGEYEINQRISATEYDVTMTRTDTTCPFIDGTEYSYTMSFSDDFDRLVERYYEKDGAAYNQTNTWERMN